MCSLKVKTVALSPMAMAGPLCIGALSLSPMADPTTPTTVATPSATAETSPEYFRKSNRIVDEVLVGGFVGSALPCFAIMNHLPSSVVGQERASESFPKPPATPRALRCARTIPRPMLAEVRDSLARFLILDMLAAVVLKSRKDNPGPGEPPLLSVVPPLPETLPPLDVRRADDTIVDLNMIMNQINPPPFPPPFLMGSVIFPTGACQNNKGCDVALLVACNDKGDVVVGLKSEDVRFEVGRKISVRFIDGRLMEGGPFLVVNRAPVIYNSVRVRARDGYVTRLFAGEFVLFCGVGGEIFEVANSSIQFKQPEIFVNALTTRNEEHSEGDALWHMLKRARHADTLWGGFEKKCDSRRVLFFSTVFIG